MGTRKKIPQDELDRLKREVSVADLAARRGVKLEPHGRDLIGLCPFHNDHEPSLVITPDKNLWHCLGACQQGGDVVAWVMKAEGVSFRHAVELLRRHDVGLASVRTTPVPPAGSLYTRKLPPPFAPDAKDHEVMRHVVNFYRDTLKESTEALAYLEKRRIGHDGAVDHFHLGYANRTLGYRLPAAQNPAGRDARARLLKLGLYRESGHEHFSGCVVFPITDESGVLTEMYGRRITHPSRGMPAHLYLPGPHKGIWNVSALSSSREVILCEAIIDALTFWCAGYRNVTTSYGVEGFTDDHLAAFKKYNLARVYIAYDRDAAGEKAAARLAPVLLENGLEVFRVEFPPDRDANDFARAVADPADALGQLLRGAVWLGNPKTPAAAAKGKELDEPAGPAADVSSEAPAKEDSAPAAVPQHLAADEQSPVLDPLSCMPPRESGEAAAISPRTAAPPYQLDEIFDGRAWRIRGLDKNTSYGVLKVGVRVTYGDRFHMDTVDLANARLRALFLKSAAQETNLPEHLLKDDLRKLLLKLEELQDALIQKKLKPADPVVTLTEAEKEEALAFLRAPDLLDRVVEDFESIGIVGEAVNVLTGYVAAVSRKFDDPLAVVIQSSSAAGKSAVMDAVLSLMPKEEREKFTAVTGQALFYMGEKNLKHKILAIVEEQGAEKATYALKLLQSEGRLTIAATGKDPTTGKLVTHEYTVEGPVVIFITTTNVEIDEELLNRVLVLTINEDREQTRRIHDLQREKETLTGIVQLEKRADVIRRHQNAQRLLRPIRVANSYAKRLTFLDTQLRTRRDHPKYLTLIRSIALLHQYQRPIRRTTIDGKPVSYIEVAPSDIEAANRIANVVLGRSLDELPPQTRRLLLLIDDLVTKRCEKTGELRADIRFSRRDLRDFTGWSDTPLKIHLARLADMEYVVVHRGRGQSFVYELLYDGQGRDGGKFCMGLIDVSTLAAAPICDYDPDRSGQNADRSGCGPGAVRPRSGGGPGRNFRATLTASKASRALLRNWAKTHIVGNGRNRIPLAS